MFLFSKGISERRYLLKGISEGCLDILDLGLCEHEDFAGTLIQNSTPPDALPEFRKMAIEVLNKTCISGGGSAKSGGGLYLYSGAAPAAELAGNPLTPPPWGVHKHSHFSSYAPVGAH